MLCISIFDTVEAKTDAESAMYGFDVDDEIYKDVKWYDFGEMWVYYKGKVIGYCDISIGMTRAKEKASDGKYMDHIFVRCLMKGLKVNSDAYGMSESLRVQSNLDTSTKLMYHAPKTQSSGSSYTIGGHGGYLEAGISADVSFPRNDLEIDNKSDSVASKVHILFDYKQPLTIFENKMYFYNESEQKAHWIYKTENSDYCHVIKITAKFSRLSGDPKKLMSKKIINAYYENTLAIAVVAPY